MISKDCEQMIKKISVFFSSVIILLLSGCATKNPLTDFQFQTVTAIPYIVASWYKIEAPTEDIRIYIEGDGHSFDAYNNPTDNPTPHSTFIRSLAANDPNPNVVYLARPCQYLQTSACSQEDWTCGRFSQNIVDSMEASILSLAKKARAQKITLIGYSGGAQVAGLVAVKNPERIKKVITIAGVLDQEAWTKYHGDTPLYQSLNLKDYQDTFNQIPQKHFIGEKDTVVPNQLTYEFVANPEQVVLVKKADHQNGFEKIYRDIYQDN